MFQFTSFPPLELFIHSRVIGFYPDWVSPFGLSRFNWYLVYSTWIFADLHVLLRLLMPRHPPLALCSFTYFRTHSIRYLSYRLAFVLFHIDDFLRISLYIFDNSFLKYLYLFLLLSSYLSIFTLYILCSCQCTIYSISILLSEFQLSTFLEYLVSTPLKRWLKNIKNIPYWFNLRLK